MSVVRVTYRPPRLWILGRRVHHGTLGLLLCLHDVRDARHWLSDLARSEVRAGHIKNDP
jgi:hypothetical protein